jgi:CRISPR-associated endonuclease Csn1
VFTTKGQYTSRLRADWALHESEIDREHGLEPLFNEDQRKDDPELEQATRRARKDPTKDRVDHRHHALDALVIALTPDYIARIGEAAAKDREYYERVGRHPRRTCMGPPWGTTEQFRSDAIEALNALIVAHRPEKRRIIGALHKETAYGKASEYAGLYCERMSVANLKSTQLIEPQYDPSSGLWRIPGKGQGRAIRDPGLRRELMECFARNGINPRAFSEKELKSLIDPSDWKLCTRSGVPIRTVTMLLTMSNPVTIRGKDDVERYYMGGNNHHMEILENDKTGQWKALFWDTYTVARRVRPPRTEESLPMVIGRELEQLRQEHRLSPELERLYAGCHFVVSLAAGETVYLKNETTGDAEFFVITEVNKARNCVVASPHWDARRAKGKGVDDPRQEIELRLHKLQRLIVSRDQIKAVVDPLGDIRWVND